MAKSECITKGFIFGTSPFSTMYLPVAIKKYESLSTQVNLSTHRIITIGINIHASVTYLVQNVVSFQSATSYSFFFFIMLNSPLLP